MKILIHSSKTMKSTMSDTIPMKRPIFESQARALNSHLLQLNESDIARLMKISPKLAKEVSSTIEQWSSVEPSPAALTFRGDIYSGLQAQEWSASDWDFAQKHLWILSGLYGILRPRDGVKPYRLEMGYKLTMDGKSLADFWSDGLGHEVAEHNFYVNLTAEEYLKAIKKHLQGKSVFTPRFLTVSRKSNEPVFVTVHTKIARGAFADWLIRNKITDPGDMLSFGELGYRYNSELSTPNDPVFVVKEFRGLGLSQRLI